MVGLVRPILRAILDATAGIQAAVHGKSLGDFSADWLLRRGVQRGIAIISEAARRMPPEQRATQPHVPGVRIMGMVRRASLRIAHAPASLWPCKELNAATTGASNA